MVDTNVLISMIFFPNEQMNSLKTEICENHSVVLCPQIIKELQSVTERKFHEKLQDMAHFFGDFTFETVYTPQFLDTSKLPRIRMNSAFRL
jgi:predicted nucleic acid-binding protein